MNKQDIATSTKRVLPPDSASTQANSKKRKIGALGIEMTEYTNDRQTKKQLAENENNISQSSSNP